MATKKPNNGPKKSRTKKDVLADINAGGDGSGKVLAMKKSIPDTGDVIEDPIDVVEENGPEIAIIEASVKDAKCTYKYKILKGANKGVIHSVKNHPGIVDETLEEALKIFAPHMAAIADMFKYAKVKVDDIDNFHNHELPLLFSVTGFKMKSDTSIVIVGNMFVTMASGRLEIDTPEIMFDEISSYKWYGQLKKAAEDACQEVLEFHNGKFTLPEVEELKEVLETGNLFEKEETEEFNKNLENAEVL